MHLFYNLIHNEHDSFSPIVAISIIREDGMALYHIFDAWQKFIDMDPVRMAPLLFGDDSTKNDLVERVIPRLNIVPGMDGLMWKDAEFFSVLDQFLADSAKQTPVGEMLSLHCGTLQELSYFSHIISLIPKEVLPESIDFKVHQQDFWKDSEINPQLQDNAHFNNVAMIERLKDAYGIKTNFKGQPAP